MLNFTRLATGLDTAPLLAKLAGNAALWSDITIRQTYPGTAHADTETIFLRGPSSFAPAAVQEGFSALVFPALAALQHEASALIEPLLGQIGAQTLGRVMIVKLKPGGHITPHIDEGAYAERFSRFHIVLQADEGNTFRCGGESLRMGAGEAWYFDHRLEHEVHNDSATDRIHVIVDVIANDLPTPRQSLRDGICVIPVSEVLQHADALMGEHYDEITLHKDVMVRRTHDERYYAMEAAGSLFVLGAYADGELVGYSANFIGPHLHYADLIYAQNDVLFLRKAYRKSRLGLQLIQATEQTAREHGCRMMHWHAKQNTALNTLLPRLGYGVQDICHSRVL